MFTDAQSFLLTYVCGCLCVGTLLKAWFHTSFPLMVTARWYKDQPLFLTNDLFMLWATNPPLNSPFLGKLLSCPTCLGTWMSLAVSFTLLALGAYGDNHPAVAAFALGWPFIIQTLERK